jgi:hypothetical protein
VGGDRKNSSVLAIAIAIVVTIALTLLLDQLVRALR